MSEHKHLKLRRNRIQKARPRIVRRWHRRLGLLSALAVVLLSVTGLLLNHVKHVYSPNSYVTAQWMLDWYGVPAPTEVQSYQEIDSPSFIWADGTILVNQEPALFNQAEFLGVYGYKDMSHLFTATDVHLFTQSGELIESISLADTAPIELVYPTSTKSVVALQSQDRVADLELDNLLINERASAELRNRARYQSLALKLQHHSPNDAEAVLARNNLLLKSRVLLDIHSGRFFGAWGVWLMDFFAVCFLLLAVSGIIAWRRSLARS